MDHFEEPAPVSFGYRIARVLPIIIGIFSVLVLAETVFDMRSAHINYPRMLVALLGLSGAIIYFLRKRRNDSIEPALTLFWVWALLQLLVVTLIIQPHTPSAIEQPIWDTSQFLQLKFGMGFSTATDNLLMLQLNLLPIIVFVWIRRLRIAENFGE